MAFEGWLDSYVSSSCTMDSEDLLNSDLSSSLSSSINRELLSTYTVFVSRVPPINPSISSLDVHRCNLVSCIEAVVGRDSIVHCKLVTERNSDRFRGCAFVQFKSESSAAYCCRLARSGILFFCNSKLTARPAEIRSNNPKSRRRSVKPEATTLISGVTLHMGCLLRHDQMCVLKTCSPITIEADNTRRRFQIILKHHSKTYKLEWRFRSLVELRKCRVQGHPSILLKVWSAPLVFQQVQGPDYFSNDAHDFVWEFAEVEWFRTRDFLEEGILGQSFNYCLELPQDKNKALDNFISAELDFPLEENHLLIIPGFPYSAPQAVVAPILSSPYVNRLPFEVIFSLNSLVQHGYLSGPSLNQQFIELLEPSMEMPVQSIVFLLDRLKRNKDTCYNPVDWFASQRENFFRMNSRSNRFTDDWMDDGLVWIHRVYVSPSRVYFEGPEADGSNRVTRHFINNTENFLRVTFVDEDYEQIPSTALILPKKLQLSQPIDPADIQTYICSILSNGITIGDKRFEFLAFSSSQLRENGVWFYASDQSTSAEKIRNWMGDFLQIRNVAECAARMGQSFSSSTKSLDVYPNEVCHQILDIWDKTHTYCFSDGIGKISESFATDVAKRCRCPCGIPSLFQIRYGGYKGVVAVDPHSYYKLSLRKSMDKFPSKQIGLDILSWSHPIPSYLNRQIIILLSTLGVQDVVFENMQKKVMQNLDQLLEDRGVALDAMQTFDSGDCQQLMVQMLSAGYYPGCEPFLKRLLYAFRAMQLMDLQKKSRIFISKGRNLMGCMDETATLNYGEVFVCVSPLPGGPHKIFGDGLNPVQVLGINSSSQPVCIVQGRVIVTKNPCLHPGDVRVLTAVDVPALYHMVDCVVFPQKGARPHPSECSGSDLDGDLYFVSWDEQLIPPQVDPPMEYLPPKQQELDHPVTIQEIQQHFVMFMVNNSLGLLSNAHVALADRRPLMARDPDCLELARLCAVAVDFPKTGVPAVLPLELKPDEYPDFMEKNDKPTYKSERVLGKLYRALLEGNNNRNIGSFTRREASRCYDRELQIRGFEHYLDEARALKESYDEKLRSLMYQFEVKTEAEIVSGYIRQLSRWYQKRHGEDKDRIMRAVGSLRKEARSWFRADERSSSCDGNSFAPVGYEELAKASAWYHVTYHPDYVEEDGEHEHLLSFPWVVHDCLLKIKMMHRNRQSMEWML